MTGSPRRDAAPKLFLAVALAFLGCAEEGVDSVFRGGGAYTVDPDRPWAEAVVVDAGRIVAVGSNSEAEGFIGPATEVVDLEGKMLLPGLQDSHSHPTLGAILEPLCRLDEATSIEGVLDAVARCSEQSSEDWLLAYGWRSSLFLPEIAPRKEDLDAIVGDRPAVMIAQDMHTFWLNSKALEAAGVTRDTPTPPGGEIVRDPETGEPLGALRDLAVELVIDVAPTPGAWESLRALRATIREMHRHGYTSLMDARVSERKLAWAYLLLDWAGLLDMRVSLGLLFDPREGLSQVEKFREMREDFSNQRIDAGVAKIFVDGGTAMGASASFLYPGDRPSHEPYIPEAALAEAVTAFDAEGFSVHLHTLGDRATRSALDAIEAARRANPGGTTRHVVTHLVFPHPSDIPRFHQLGVVANISPWWAFPNEWTAAFPPVLGPERTSWMYPFASLQRSGACIAAGSDYPFTPLGPFDVIEAGITRRDPLESSGPTLVEDEALTLEALLAAYTINAAYQLFQEDKTGSIEVGKLADLIVIDRDLFAIPVESISETRVLLTMIEGKVVYRATKEDWR